MTSRTRTFVLAVSVPVIAFAVIGGFLGQAMTRDDTFRYLAVFEDVVSIVLNNYVEEVDIEPAMKGAMHGLSEGLDSDSAYVSADLAKSLDSAEPVGAGEIGLDMIRQYYLRVVSTRDGSPAAKAGLQAGDYVRAIDGRSTRNLSGLEGARLLRGKPGTTVTLLIIRGSAVEPHTVDLVREALKPADVTSRVAAPGIGYVRVPEFTDRTPAALKTAIDNLTKGGASRFVVDLRGTSRGDLDDGIAAARLFVKSGTLAIRQTRDADREVIVTQAADGSVAAPVTLLVSTGTSGAAEVFAAAIDGNDRGALVGQRTLGRVARQRLVRLPDGSGLWLSYLRHLTPAGEDLHERGLTPDVPVEQPEVEFGSAPSTEDPVLDKAIEQFTAKIAA